MIKKILLLSIISVLLSTVLESASAQVLFRDKKAYGAIPDQSVTLSIGFLSGQDLTQVTDYLEFWATKNGGFDNFDEINSSPSMQAGYEFRIAPLFFLTTKLNFSYLKTESTGEYVKDVDPSTKVALDINRELKIYLFNLDLGLKHYFSKPKPKNICPYVAVGFSAVLPMVRLNTDSYRSGTDSLFYNPEETVSKNSLVVGAHAEFGINFFITNRFSAGFEARFQTCQSDFEIHNANFDLKYAGFGLAFIASHHF